MLYGKSQSNIEFAFGVGWVELIPDTFNSPKIIQIRVLLLPADQDCMQRLVIPFLLVAGPCSELLVQETWDALHPPLAHRF